MKKVPIPLVRIRSTLKLSTRLRILSKTRIFKWWVTISRTKNVKRRRQQNRKIAHLRKIPIYLWVPTDDSKIVNPIRNPSDNSNFHSASRYILQARRIRRKTMQKGFCTMKKTINSPRTHPIYSEIVNQTHSSEQNSNFWSVSHHQDTERVKLWILQKKMMARLRKIPILIVLVRCTRKLSIRVKIPSKIRIWELLVHICHTK